MFWPCETRTSTCRSFATISSGLYRFLAIAVLLDVKDIPQVGPLQWGRITTEYFFAAFLVPPPALAQCALPSLRFSSIARPRVCAQALPHHHTPVHVCFAPKSTMHGSNNDYLRAPRCKRVAVWWKRRVFP